MCHCQRLYLVIPHFDHQFLIFLQMQFSGAAKQILVQNPNNVQQRAPGSSFHV